MSMKWCVGRRWCLALFMFCAGGMLASSAFSEAGSHETARNVGHFTLSAGFGFLSESYLNAYQPQLPSSVWGGIVLGMIPGVLKEVHDQQVGSTWAASRHDLVLDLVGAVSGALLSSYWRKKEGWSVLVGRDNQGLRLTLRSELNLY